MLDDLDLSNIADEHARQAIQLLLNLVETLSAENRALREENQRLRDENNRLKGEQGKPDIKPNKRPPATNHSSEEERHKERPHQKGRKVDQITIDRTVPICCATAPIATALNGLKPKKVKLYSAITRPRNSSGTSF